MTAGNRVVRVNREFTRLFGYAPEETVGRSLGELVIPEESREEAVRSAALVACGQRVDVETVRRRKDGSRLDVSLTRVPVSVGGGDVETYAIYRDITERKKAEDALRSLPARLIEAQEGERDRIARELHDEIGQQLTSIGLMLSLSRQLPGESLQARLDEARSILDDLIGRVRNLALDLRPALLDDFGLLPALQSLCERYRAQTGVHAEIVHFGVENRRFGGEIETAAYRVVQEALTNVARHARIGAATVLVAATHDALVVEIDDRGVGFDPGAVESSDRSIGLAGMRERATILRGQMTVQSSPDSGTWIVVELPLREDSEEPPGST